VSDVRPGLIDLGSCLGTYGGPIFPNVVLGGYDCVSIGSGQTSCNYMNATAMILTIPIDNHVRAELNGPAEAWEKVFLDFMGNYSSPIFTVAYSAERSTSVRMPLEIACVVTHHGTG
jgi:Niemann-Pick C1 protein